MNAQNATQIYPVKQSSFSNYFDLGETEAISSANLISK